MTLTACSNCGTHTNPGSACPRCGTPAPSATAAPAAVGYDAYWWSIHERLQRAAAPKYDVNGILGYGGMAGVFLALEPRLGRKVAIKVMSPALMMDPGLVERFQQEARTIALLSHPNIVTIYEVDQRDDMHWFAMAHVPGRTLGEVMTDATEPLPVPVVGAWLYQIADALAYAHQQGVVHRDIKPGNVLLDVRGNALVTDFGIAKVTDGETTGLTRTGMLVGTPTYMSPEQCSSGRVTGASDQYSLGAVIYQMLTGFPPFVGPTLAVIQAHLNQQPTPIQDLREDCPESLANAVHRMLEKDPDQRWPTMSAAIAAAGCTVPGFDDPVRKLLEELATRTAKITAAETQLTVREGARAFVRTTLATASGKVVSGRRVTWTAADPSVAVVEHHELWALSPGTTELTATSGSARLTLTVSVEADPIGGIAVAPAQLTVSAGKAAQLEAIVQDIDGSRLDDRAVLWRSNNPAVARVSNTGMVEGVEPGEALVAARTGGKFITAAVTVVRGAHSSYSQPVTTPRPATSSRPNVSVRGDRSAAAAAVSVSSVAQTSVPTAAASDAPPRRESPVRSRTPVIGGVVALLLLIVAVVLKPWAGGSGSAPATAGRAMLAFSGVMPAGGSVTARDASGGSWQLSNQPLELAPGSYTLEFRAPGYEVADSLVALSDGDSVSWALEPRAVVVASGANTADGQKQPQPAAIPDGTVALGAALPPGGFAVARDRSGRTWPLSSRATALPPGSYTLEFSAPGYQPSDSTIDLRSGQSSVWSPNMREATRAAEPPREATLEVRGSVPRGATLVARDAGGRAWPLVGGRSALPPGTYTLEFSAAGYDAETQSITLRAGQTDVWSPAMRAAAKAPPPAAPDVRADQAAIGVLVREFRARFDSRDTSAVRLLPAASRTTWTALFLNRTVSDFSATLGAVEPARVNGDSATVQFTLNVSFRSGNQNPTQVLPYTGTARRTQTGWQLVSLENRR